jgi:hypothetical protein
MLGWQPALSSRAGPAARPPRTAAQHAARLVAGRSSLRLLECRLPAASVASVGISARAAAHPPDWELLQAAGSLEAAGPRPLSQPAPPSAAP